MTRGMGIAIRARYPARNPGEGEPSGVGEGGLDLASAVDGVAVIIGYLRAGWEPGGLSQPRVPAIERRLNLTLGGHYAMSRPA
jgi:hypothetical protein